MSKAPRPSIDDSFSLDQDAILKRAKYLSKFDKLANRFGSSDSLYQKNQSMPDLCEINENSSEIILMAENQSPLIVENTNTVQQVVTFSGNNEETSPTANNGNISNIHQVISKLGVNQGISSNGTNMMMNQTRSDVDLYLTNNKISNNESLHDLNANNNIQNMSSFQNSISNFEQISNWLDQTSIHQLQQSNFSNQNLDLLAQSNDSPRIQKEQSNIIMHPNAPRISSPTESNSSISSFPSLFNRPQDFSDKRIRSRFRGQNRDKFSVRVSNLHCSMDPSKGIGRRIFVTFQAQFPRHYPNSSTMHLVNIPHGSSSPIGVRLSLCCALDGEGPSLDDFKTPTIQDRLNHWESNYGSGKLGFCQEVLSSLKGTIEKILQKINYEGLNSIQTDIEYQFYPETGTDLVIIPNSNRTRHLSTSSDSGLLQTSQLINSNQEKMTHISQENNNQKSLKDNELLKNLESLVNATNLVNLHGINNQLSQLLLNSQASSNNSLTPQCLNQNKLVDYLVRQSSLQELSKNAQSNFIPLSSNNENSTQEKFISNTNQFQIGYRSNLTRNDSVQSINENQNILSKVEDAIEKLRMQSKNNEYNNNLANSRKISHPSGKIMMDLEKSDPYHHTSTSNTNNNSSAKIVTIQNIISEVGKRLTENPNLPLIVMPGDYSSSSVDSRNPDSNNALPYIFQINNPSSIIIGFPGEANRNHQPRVVTSPISNTIIVTSDRSDPSTLQSEAPNNFKTRVLPPPKPGFSLVINSRGQVFQQPDNTTSSPK